jgi:hypothetical protein
MRGDNRTGVLPKRGVPTNDLFQATCDAGFPALPVRSGENVRKFVTYDPSRSDSEAPTPGTL